MAVLLRDPMVADNIREIDLGEAAMP